jgi:UDP-N-acetylglucosamine 2-epimerase (non-hydrolysing)
MGTLRIMSVVGARPNFIKIAPFIRAIQAHNEKRQFVGSHIDHFLVHTGQHYDRAMSDTFFRALAIPESDAELNVGSGTYAQQVGHTMIAFENVVRQWHPDWIVVVGDVDATCACAITAKKEHVGLAHIEAGLRSFDLDMPEEINRMVTDRLSDMLFTTDEIADGNLKREGTPEERIRRVGNIVIDTLQHHREEAAELDLGAVVDGHTIEDTMSGATADLRPGEYAVMTLHRPSNVDDPHTLEKLVSFFVTEVAETLPLVWLMHPRTRKNLKSFDLWTHLRRRANLLVLEPVGYLEMLKLQMDARIMLTDSGGLQEESCVLGTPCLTLRWNTERPKTLVEHGGGSVLVGNDVARIRTHFRGFVQRPKRPHRPDLWDGRTAYRIVDNLVGAGHRC